jgi:hypothetical protein
MQHHEPSTLLATAETIHWIALAIMAIVYSVRLVWLLQFRNARERQPAGRPDKTNATRGRAPATACPSMRRSSCSTSG